MNRLERDDEKVRSGEGKTPVIPLPPPPPARLASLLFALAAAIAGFLGFSRTAAIFASLSLGTNVLDYLTRRPAGEKAGKAGG